LPNSESPFGARVERAQAVDPMARPDIARESTEG
jgi:hypothetical protein